MKPDLKKEILSCLYLPVSVFFMGDHCGDYCRLANDQINDFCGTGQNRQFEDLEPLKVRKTIVILCSMLEEESTPLLPHNAAHWWPDLNGDNLRHRY